MDASVSRTHCVYIPPADAVQQTRPLKHVVMKREEVVWMIPQALDDFHFTGSVLVCTLVFLQLSCVEWYPIPRPSYASSSMSNARR